MDSNPPATLLNFVLAPILVYIFVFFFGLIVGSFLNCLIYRLEMRDRRGTGEGLSLFGRSFCPHCKHTLSWQDLIPVLSFLFLKGKCRYCSQKISLQYPLVELATAVLFTLIFSLFLLEDTNYTMVYFVSFGEMIFYWIITCFLIIIFVYDLKHYLIPDQVIYPAIAITFFYQLFRIGNFRFILDFGFWNLDFESLINPLLSTILTSAFFLVIVLVSRGKWMGLGDFKLAVLMGLFLGWPNILVALFLAFFIGAIIGLGLIAAQKKTLKSEVPFGPFLVSATFLALFWGRDIINWYLNYFNGL